MTTKITLNNIADTALATLTGPKVTTIVYPGTETATDVAGGATINLTGGGFQSGCSVLVASTASSVVTFISSTQISFIAPALSAGTYVIYVINPDGGTAISIPGVSYSGTPNWTTTAGTLGDAYETGAISATLTATGDAPITYTLASGTLPTGSTLASNGTLSGTAVASASATTYTFAVTARDAQNQTTNRSFSLTINPDVVSWVTPTASATYTVEKDTVMANVTMSATSAAGGSITYTADTLPTGLSITGANIAGTPTVTANTSTILTATSTATRSATRIINWVVSVANDTYFPYTTLLLSGNGTNNAQNNTFLDSSTNNVTITRAGNTTQGMFSPYGANWSLYTNGTNSYAYLPYNATRSIGTGDFSIECWVYIARQPADYTRVWSHQSNWGLSGSVGVELAFGTIDSLIQTLVDGNSTTYASATYDTSGTGGSGHVRQWIHVVSSRQNGYLRLIVNGILREANTNSTNINGTSTTSFGTNSQLGGDLTELYISNFRMCIGSVPTAYSTTSTTGGTIIFTPPTSPVTTTSQGATGVQLLLFQNNRIIDTSSNAFAVTTVNNPRIQRFSPFSPGAVYSASTIGGSAYFDGSGDYLLNTGTTAGQLGSGNFTFECWYYPTNATFGTGGANTAAGIFFDSRATAPDANGLSFYTMTNGTVSIYTNSGVIFTSSNALKAFAWNHIAFVRSGSTITTYINGVSGGTVTSSVNFSSGRLQISGPVDYAAGYIELVGYVCDHRVVKGTAVYTGTFTPPTEPLTAVANTSLLLNYTNAGIIDNTMQNNLETVGDAKISTTQSKFGGSSMYFDGTGDYCFIQNTQSFLFGRGNFTIELWAYIGDTSTRKYILGPGTDTASHYDGFGVEIWGQQLCVWASSNGTGWDMIECDTTGNRGATLLSANTWYHIAVTRSGNTFRTFVNGVVEKTYTSSAAVFSDTTVPYNIGRSGYSPGNYFYFNGYMDDLRVTRGYARYTANFTPPTSAFNGR